MCRGGPPPLNANPSDASSDVGVKIEENIAMETVRALAN